MLDEIEKELRTDRFEPYDELETETEQLSSIPLTDPAETVEQPDSDDRGASAAAVPDFDEADLGNDEADL